MRVQSNYIIPDSTVAFYTQIICPKQDLPACSMLPDHLFAVCYLDFGGLVPLGSPPEGRYEEGLYGCAVVWAT